MIEVKNISVFDSNCEALVNPINCLGKMGKGLALEFKNKFPEMYENYVKRCNAHQIQIGSLYVYPTYYKFKSGESKGILVIGLPTKLEYWKPSRLEYIDKGMDALVTFLKETQIKSIAIPKLGCGFGGLDWTFVKEMILKKIWLFENDKSIKIIICEY